MSLLSTVIPLTYVVGTHDMCQIFGNVSLLPNFFIFIFIYLFIYLFTLFTYLFIFFFFFFFFFFFGSLIPFFSTKAYLYNFDPLKSHFYVVKLGFTGYALLFLFLPQNINCGYSLEPPRRGGSNGYQHSMF